MYLPTVMFNLVPKMRLVVLAFLLISAASGSKKPEKVTDPETIPQIGVKWVWLFCQG